MARSKLPPYLAAGRPALMARSTLRQLAQV